MLQTLGYFFELTLSIYFFCVVILFMINVCEFMPLTSHEAIEEEKILIRSYSKPEVPEKKAVLHAENDQDKRWKGQSRKLPKSKSWDKVTPPQITDQREEVKGGEKAKENRAQPEPETEQSPEAPARNQEPQEPPADDGPVTAPADEGTAVTAMADNGPATTPTDDGPAGILADDGPVATPADDAPTANDATADPPNNDPTPESPQDTDAT